MMLPAVFVSGNTKTPFVQYIFFLLMFPSEKDNILKRYVEEGVAGTLPGLVAQHTMDTFYDSSVITAR